MARIIKILKVLRNNWKKSLFFSGALSYGVKYGVDKYNSFQLMREYCEEALQYGDVPVPQGSRPRHITVILNPAANKRSSKADFEKYCAPLLYLAGIAVNVVQTESEGQARTLVESLDGIVDAIVVAGGDGTVSETITGLLRRSDGDLAVQRRFPIGILPLGRTNTVAESLFSNNNSNKVKMMADATMSIVREITKPIDVLKIEVLQETEDETPGKPIYSLSGVHWGAYRDAEAKKDKYWYWGTLRSYAAYVFMGWKDKKNGMTWQCDGELTYILPCGGCNKCHQAQETEKKTSYRWWQVFLPRQSQSTAEKDYSKIINERCGEKFQKDISTVDLSITTANTCPNCTQEGDPHVEIGVGKYHELKVNMLVKMSKT
ncbi:Acylglycerol kinase [Blattella germanica]|nr:Acylglycerol kinase [Blattella germanica]